ncbi:MAG: HAMP domain-containing sensor histidine kinase, partial [Cyanobacteria bacterium J06600_6]
HEFRNPLNSISGMAQILEAYGDNLKPEKKKEVLQQLQRNVTKMTNLLNDVLLVSQKDMDKLQFNPAPVKLAAFCRSVIGEVQSAFKQTTINFDYQAEKQEFNLDRHLLDCVLTNLLSNACKYSPEAEIVDFEVSSQAEKLTFIVRDRGIGIPAVDLPYLFDSFYRASNSLRQQGTGLGLAIAKNYIEQHQGTISVSSELGVGTVFTVIISLS